MTIVVTEQLPENIARTLCDNYSRHRTTARKYSPYTVITIVVTEQLPENIARTLCDNYSRHRTTARKYSPYTLW